jgi:hypothetical protein
MTPTRLSTVTALKEVPLLDLQSLELKSKPISPTWPCEFGSCRIDEIFVGHGAWFAEECVRMGVRIRKLPIDRGLLIKHIVVDQTALVDEAAERLNR